MNLLRSFLQAGTKDSLMRLCSFLAILCVCEVTTTICAISIIAVLRSVSFEGLDKVANLIGALGIVIGALGSIILWKGVQSLGENQKKENDEEVR